MCVFEILHFLPLALIALSALSLKGKSSGLFSVMVLALSAIGLIAGNHSHVDHDAFFGMADPCIVYAVAIAISSFTSLRTLKNKFTRVNA